MGIPQRNVQSTSDLKNILDDDLLRKCNSWSEVRKLERGSSLKLPKRCYFESRENYVPPKNCKVQRLAQLSATSSIRVVSSQETNRERIKSMVQWFEEFTDVEKTTFLQAIIPSCGVEQNHILSTVLQDSLHLFCGPNCQDPFSFLPNNVVQNILSRLDHQSLGRASQVCRLWHCMTSTDELWQRLASTPPWQLSKSGQEKQLKTYRREDGTMNWKKIFVERFKLYRNWTKGYCHVRTFEGHSQAISCIQFDGSRIVSGSHDKTIRVWDMRTNSPWSVITLNGHSGTVRCLHLLDNRLVSGSTDRSIKLWDLSIHSQWSGIACKVTMVGHTDTVRCIQMDNTKVVSGSYDCTVRVWNSKSGNCERILIGHEGHVLCVQFLGDILLSGSADKTIKVWDLPSGLCSKTLRGHREAVTCVSFDQSRIFSGSLDRTIKVWNLSLGQCINTLDWMTSEGHTGVIRCLQADATKLVSAADDRTLKVWSLDTGQRIATLRNHTDGVTCLQFNDFVIVSGSYDRTVKLWDFGVC